jgi:transcriptional regulator GlxA family with amidase domain
MTPCAPKRRTVGITIFDDVEVLDFCGPFEVFSVARPPGREEDDARLFNVITLAATPEVVRARYGLRVLPDYTLDDHPPLDLLIVPGGRGTRRERRNGRLLDWIAQQSTRMELIASVCTGAFLLAECGLLDGKRATTHWGSVDAMRDTYTNVELVENTRVVDEGRVLTAAGISAGIDLSLHLVARLHGADVAAWTARHMEYDWNPALALVTAEGVPPFSTTTSSWPRGSGTGAPLSASGAASTPATPSGGRRP